MALLWAEVNDKGDQKSKGHLPFAVPDPESPGPNQASVVSSLCSAASPLILPLASCYVSVLVVRRKWVATRPLEAVWARNMGVRSQEQRSLGV